MDHKTGYRKDHWIIFQGSGGGEKKTACDLPAGSLDYRHLIKAKIIAVDPLKNKL